MFAMVFRMQQAPENKPIRLCSSPRESIDFKFHFLLVQMKGENLNRGARKNNTTT